MTISRMVGTASLCWVRPIARARDDPVAPGDEVDEPVDVAAFEAGGSQQVVCVELAEVLDQLAQSVAVLGREAWSSTGSARRVALDEEVVDELEEGEVGPDADREEEVGDGRTAADQPGGALGFLNRSSPASGSGLIATTWAPSPLGLLQRGQHPRVVGAGVLADDEQMRRPASMSSSDTVPLPTPMVSRQGDAARLVAHVRAVRQVVGAEQPDEQLVEERRLVARAAGRVEHGLVRASWRRSSSAIRSNASSQVIGS